MHTSHVFAVSTFQGSRGAALRLLSLDEAAARKPDELKRAYKKAASTAHPDASGGSTAAFQEVQNAYEFLKQNPLPPPPAFPRRTTRVWDEGVLQEDFVTEPLRATPRWSKEPFSQEPRRKPGARADAFRRERGYVAQPEPTLEEKLEKEKKLAQERTIVMMVLNNVQFVAFAMIPLATLYLVAEAIK